ncbi:hypothetical protein ACFO25_06755 [Paenactinomyces guangxiensis]|uniref:Uncharacterized protein n=1 Tax=Paenactinomyces guangxiensis TaxID=1490290 RepID=A0A7W2A772_9BACL|nr:hypothetical protein [Paenactinomyces guangxiensis]MBA4493250.1 hypothetical protein [Paenactinomyces guangxiensis]MBH8589899.1 hypothetical protein [Paenactinomyces guangxiensis]
MKVLIPKTGDPWTDIGIVTFYQELEHIQDHELLESLHLAPGHLEFEIEVEYIDEVKQLLQTRMKDKLNRILLPPVELKLLKRNQEWSKKDAAGFLNERFKTVLTDSEIEFLKSKTDEHGREKPFLSHPQKNVEMTSMRNFIGIKGDWKRATKTYIEEINDFFDQYHPGSKKKKVCPLCGRLGDPAHFHPMNQSRNVLFNQHHGVPVRGYNSSVAKEKMCPTCNLLNLYSTVQVHWHPYFVSNKQVTHLLIPELNDLVTLNKLFRKVEAKLYNLLKETRLVSYRTNIAELKVQTLYVSLLQLYFWMNYVREEAEFHYDPLDPTTRRSIKNWIIPRYSKGQNVIFKDFSRVSVREDIFNLTKRIPYGRNKVQEGDVVYDFIYQIRSEDPRLIDQIAEGIFRKDRGKIVEALFQLFKLSLRNDVKNSISYLGLSFFPDFFTYLNAEVDKVISEQLQADLRSLGAIIGQNCYDDLSLLTKLNAAASKEAFIRALKEATFKMYKAVQASRKDRSSKADEQLNVGAEKINHILSHLDEENILTIRDTMMIYANLSAFWATKKKKEKGAE